jgi:hypothetical protein
MTARSVARLLLLLPGLAGCASAVPARGAPAQQSFFSELQRLCGRAFVGSVLEAPASDTLFSGRRLVMHVQECTAERVVIPVQVGDDRSRTWIVSRDPAGLRLTHVHRHPDGTEDENSRYGGVTRAAGTAHRQDFPADSVSIRAVPGRATQSWTLELWPGEAFDYSLHRVSTDLRIRFRFDLARPLP